MANLIRTQVWFDDGTTQTFAAAPSPPVAPGQPTIPAAVPYKTVVRSITFPGTTLDPATWETTVWYDKPDTAGDISDHGGGVSHPPNVKVANGVLSLTASSPTPTVPTSWLCGWVDSAPYFTFVAPCYVGVRAQCPKMGPGMWPAMSFYEDGLKGSTTYAEIDLLEYVWTPDQSGPSAWQSWHPAGSGKPTGDEIGIVGVDLTGWHDYGVSIDATGTIQFWFDGQPNDAPIVVGANALEQMFLSFTNSTGGQANDGWAGVPTAATPNPSVLNLSGIVVSGP